jgi:hypothetical protein
MGTETSPVPRHSPVVALSPPASRTPAITTGSNAEPALFPIQDDDGRRPVEARSPGPTMRLALAPAAMQTQAFDVNALIG